jgi:hypothetical protein
MSPSRRKRRSKSPGDRRIPMACRRCRRLKKKCRKDEGLGQCRRCIPGNFPCEFIDVASDLAPPGFELSDSGSPFVTSPATPASLNGFHSQPGPVQQSPCPYIRAVQSEHSALSNVTTYPPPPYPPPGFISITDGNVHSPPPLPHTSSPPRQEADFNDPSQSPPFRRSHFTGSPSPRDLIRSLPTDYGLSNYNATHLTAYIPHVAASSSGSSNPSSPYESHSLMPHGSDASANSYITDCNYCATGHCVFHFRESY